MTEYSYSLTEEDGYSDDIYDCIQEWKDNFTSGDYPFEMEVYKGEKVTFSPSHFLPDLVDEVENQMCDEVGEWGDGWALKLRDKSKKLQDDFKKFFDTWCKENDCEVDFHNVENAELEKWIIRSDDDYEVIK